jgi:NTE family protein
MKIALALSGGGFRATVFHLGVLSRLAASNQLENVSVLSTVSGGSLCAGLVFTLNGFQWPTSAAYREIVLPAVRQLLTTVDLKALLVRRSLLHILKVTQPRADDLSVLMREHWGINIPLNRLPEQPRWMINATCYESGKNWRFERSRMGDYVFGYSKDTDLPLSDAMAASAGFPGLIGALSLETSSRSWFQYVNEAEEVPGEEALPPDDGAPRQPKTESIQPAYSPVHLWDGGLYDNHGLEGLHDFHKGWTGGFDFLIVSDAAGRSKPQAYQPGAKALMRIITGVLMDQVRSLRTRAILERILDHHDRGVFLQTGSTCEQVLRATGKAEEIAVKRPGYQSSEDAEQVANMDTDIAKLPVGTFERAFRHGYEVANVTLYAYYPDRFQYIDFEK